LSTTSATEQERLGGEEGHRDDGAKECGNNSLLHGF
jgi:hypothetical protein